MKQIAIYGGSFDPIHNAHTEIIKRLSGEYDVVVVIPTTIRYYKENKQMFSFSARFNSVVEKTKTFANVKVLDIERSVSDNWRFINSLLAVKKIYGEENEYFLAMGSDSFQKFKTWCSWENIVKEVSSIIVFHRPGFEEKDFPSGIKFEYIKDMDMNISSTYLREQLRNYLSEAEDFDMMIDDLLFCKGYEEYLEDYHY